ncbi:histidine-containing phosphotransfer protein 4-like isoform X1 [Salvia hispanica]|uniref:histidine-containing phosphotransfer protein 4-like isoform X1 n=2 Tax=Salvia hispanica TaxID=49212 RepID=UPI002009217A|nr:histidine-containing phosphotransfer protein 4-like isoform X1 [Salvia hispanica]
MTTHGNEGEGGDLPWIFFSIYASIFSPIYNACNHMPLFLLNPEIQSILSFTCFVLFLFITMEGNQLSCQASYMRNALFNQGYLDDQFLQLEDLQDEANPNFVEEVVKLFYSDSARLIRNIELTLENTPWDFEKLDNIMHQYKGSSSSIGAKKVKKECTQFQEYCKVENIDGCMRTFQEVKQEHASLKRKLENYFQLVREAR